MVDPVPELRMQKPAANAVRHNEDLSRLDVFLGEWEVDGRQLGGPLGPAADITARETYEWMPGGHFMLMRFDGLLGEEEMGCVEVIGEAPHPGHGFCAHSYYNDGTRRIWRMGEKHGVWIRTGEEMTGGGLTRTRCTMTFSDGGQRYAGVWELSKDGESWTPFWNMTARHTG